MATALAFNDNKNEYLEVFCLIWLDSNPQECRNTEQKLRSIINQLKKFSNVPQCQQYIQETSAKDRVVLIASGTFGREILPTIHHIRQLISVYIYCMDKKANEQWSSKYLKVKGVVTNTDELISKITTDHRIENKIEEPLAINIFSVGGKATTGINGKFVFFQVLIDCLLRLKSIDRDKIELIQLLKQQYQGNTDELYHINEFEKTYKSNQVLQWYTKESFFYKTLNSVLRTENIHMIFLHRSFIFDIQQQLLKYQTNHIFQVYRAQIISKEEFKSLQESINQFISINSFFSTSVNYSKALSFFKNSKLTENTEKILFHIEINSNIVQTKSFANISQFSQYPDEEEVLFMIGSIFRLRNISFDQINHIWIIQMSLANDEDNELKHVLMYIKQQIGHGETNLRILAKILSKMGQFQLAEKYLKRFLKQLSSNDPLVGELYEDLAELASHCGHLDKSMEWYKKSLEYKGQKQPQLKTNLKWKQQAITIAGSSDGGGKQLNQLCWPVSIYVDDNQQAVYVADCWNHRIVKWTFGVNNGQLIAGRTEKGNRIDQLSYPTDLIVDQNNKSLIICDNGNNRIVRWPLESQQDRQIIISDIGCYGLMMNKNGDLFVSDQDKHEVIRWRIDEKERTIVAGGNGEGKKLNQLNSPTHIFIDRNDTVYVSDWRNHRVMKWTKGASEGIIVAGGEGQGNSFKQLSYPMGVFVNDAGDVYVADGGNYRIMCWPSGSQEGRLIMGQNNQGVRGLLFDRQNNLYVVDCGNHQIQRFDVDQS